MVLSLIIRWTTIIDIISFKCLNRNSNSLLVGVGEKKRKERIKK